MPTPKHIDFIEFPAPDAAALRTAKAFYTRAFGWRYQGWGDDYSDTQAQDSGIGTGISSQPGTCPHPWS